MATLQLEDLLRDELAGSGTVCAWECALQMLFLRADPSALARVKSQAIKASIPHAIKNLEAWIAQAAQITATVMLMGVARLRLCVIRMWC